MSRAASQKRRRLDRGTVVDAAIAYADAHGLAELSMRRLAVPLAVTPMALYKHIASREELIDEMVERLVADIAPAPRGAAWKIALRARILSARAVMQRHTWAQGAIEARAAAGPAVLGYMNDLMGLMFAGGLSADLVHHAMHALGVRMWGLTADVLPTPTMPADPAQHADALAGYAQQYPAIVRMATTAPRTGTGCDSDAEFAFALDILIDAFERLHEAGWASRPGAASPGVAESGATAAPRAEAHADPAARTA